MFQCTFCEKQVAQVGEKELNSGWSRTEGSYSDKRVRVVSCPEHRDLAWEEFFKRMSEIEKPSIDWLEKIYGE